jgi:glycine/D-amino acid oxidase-like deaminating enzyme/nitrite reductase/ring-hydroxylating ferredoxin subunit
MEGGTPGPGKHSPLWMNTDIAYHPPLAGDLTVDVAIVGGGLTGLNTALLLADAGAKVAVIEGRRIGTGVSGHTTAKITSQHGLIYNHLLSAFGTDAAFSYAQANQAALAKYAELISTHDISCDFLRKVAITYTERADGVSAIEKEVEAAGRIGLPAQLVHSLDLSFPIQAAISFPGQGQFHPRKYMQALTEILARRGVALFEETWVEGVSDGSPAQIRTAGGKVLADAVIMANHSPSPYSFLFFTRMVPKRSYVLAVEAEGPLPAAMYYSTGEPYRSLRTQPDGEGELLLVGGQNHKTGYQESSAERYRRLEVSAREHFRIRSVRYSWSTQDNVTMDRVPYIGKVPVTKNVYLAIGFGGWGMTHSMVAAQLLTDMLGGRVNEWKLLYDPARVHLKGASKAIQQNIHYVKHVVTDHLPLGEVIDPRALGPGEGKVGKMGNRKMAVARDMDGVLHRLSATCTHMGCGLSYNDGELSWDCPCHGSRFDTHGRVLHGPAATPLTQVSPPEERSDDE